MYQVTIDGKHLCSTNAANGFAAVEDPTAKLIVNGADSFDFTVYPQHPLYADIVCKVSRVKIQQDGKLIFYGTVSGYTETLYGVRTYSCEGALSWLNELCLPVYHLSNMTPKQVFSWYIEMYNDTVQDASKKFTVGSVTIAKATTKAGTEGTIARSSGLFPTFWEEISEKLLDAFGGILRIRYKGTEECAGVIDWLAIPDATCGQDIKYAKNLVDCDWSYDGTPIVTAVIPLGKKQGSSTEDEVRIDIHKTNDASMTVLLEHLFGHGDFVKSGNMVYSKSRVEKYGLIQQTVTFDDESNTDTIAYLGAVWLDQNGKVSSTIWAEAIDIADIDETVSHFVCGDYVRARLPGSTQDMIFPITAIEIPIAAPEDARITVGTQETNATSGGSGGGSITEVGSGADALAHTHANKGVLDKITAQDYSDFKGAVNKAHAHENKDTLDKIDDTSWTRVYGMSHEHDNKSVLDGTTASYTAEEQTKLAGIAVHANNYQHPSAAGYKHIPVGGSSGQILRWSADGTAVWGEDKDTTYTNVTTTKDGLMIANDKKKLDGIGVGAQVNQNAFSKMAVGVNDTDPIEATSTTDTLSFSGGDGVAITKDKSKKLVTITAHSHDNKSVLDKLTAQDYSDFKGAVNKSHTHTNKDTLDKLDGDWWTQWLSAYGNMHTHSNTLLDVKNYTNYAADKNHTHAVITNSVMDLGSAGGAVKWIRLGTIVSAANGRTMVIRVWSGDGFNARINQNSSFEIHIKDSWQSTASATNACAVTVYRINCPNTVTVKVIPTDAVTYTVWIHPSPWTYWNGNYAIYGYYKSWTRQYLTQDAEPTGTGAAIAYYDQAFLTSTVANATTWNGLVDDTATYNSADTWLLVKNGNKIQHRLSYELVVKESATLTETAWTAVPTTGGAATSTNTLKYKKSGNTVHITGSIRFSSVWTAPVCGTLPAGYRPATAKWFAGWSNDVHASYGIRVDMGGIITLYAPSTASNWFVPSASYNIDVSFMTT